MSNGRWALRAELVPEFLPTILPTVLPNVEGASGHKEGSCCKMGTQRAWNMFASSSCWILSQGP